MSLRFWLSFQVRCVVVLSPASFCLQRLFYPRPTRTAIRWTNNDETMHMLLVLCATTQLLSDSSDVTTLGYITL